MAETLITFCGSALQVERDFNEWIRTTSNTYFVAGLTGTKDNLVLGIIYKPKDETVKSYY